MLDELGCCMYLKINKPTSTVKSMTQKEIFFIFSIITGKQLLWLIPLLPINGYDLTPAFSVE